MAIAWAYMAYLVLPFALRHYEHQTALNGLEMVTRTADGLAGDPLNVGVVGSRSELVTPMAAAGWTPADPVTLRTSIEIVASVVLDRAYHDAPVSPLFYQGRQQDFAIEKAVGRSADRRQHVRFWNVLSAGAEGRPVWLGSTSFNVGVGLSHYTGAVTHAISPDVDAMRDELTADLARIGRVAEVYEVTGVGLTLNGRNGEGDRYYTNGEIRFSSLAPPGVTGRQPPPALPNPPLIDLKNELWNAVTD
ncbi:LssY C-terminal domain-containing protein [Aureimonas sp. Leaf324]|uniref:LssY C-terminal domain-containing protein n=1 Tax=Aureimonas sp. Leaf324 TaxID=1736336 RepID=UPI001FCD47AD|nr:LssY C-terminal domain-containing protein [Aureimonas sp. Leaf324]